MRQQSIAKLIPLYQLESEWGGVLGNMGAQSEIAYGEDGLNKLNKLDGEFLLTLNSLNSLISPLSILNYQLSIINSPYPPRPKKILQNQRPNRQIYHL